MNKRAFVLSFLHQSDNRRSGARHVWTDGQRGVAYKYLTQKESITLYAGGCPIPTELCLSVFLPALRQELPRNFPVLATDEP